MAFSLQPSFTTSTDNLLLSSCFQQFYVSCFYTTKCISCSWSRCCFVFWGKENYVCILHQFLGIVLWIGFHFLYCFTKFPVCTLSFLYTLRIDIFAWFSSLSYFHITLTSFSLFASRHFLVPLLLLCSVSYYTRACSPKVIQKVLGVGCILFWFVILVVLMVTYAVIYQIP